jgi:hypothetical protein
MIDLMILFGGVPIMPFIDPTKYQGWQMWLIAGLQFGFAFIMIVGAIAGGINNRRNRDKGS